MSHSNPVTERMSSGSRGRSAHLATLSVVITSDGDLPMLERAVASIRRRCDQFQAEVIVLCNAQTQVRDSLFGQNHRVRVVTAPAGSSERDLRVLAMQEASGDIVAIRPDHRVGDARWLDAFCRATTGAEASELDSGDSWESVLADPTELVVADWSRRSGSSRMATPMSSKLLAPEIGDASQLSRERVIRDRRSADQPSVSREI